MANNSRAYTDTGFPSRVASANPSATAQANANPEFDINNIIGSAGGSYVPDSEINNRIIVESNAMHFLTSPAVRTENNVIKTDTFAGYLGIPLRQGADAQTYKFQKTIYSSAVEPTAYLDFTNQLIEAKGIGLFQIVNYNLIPQNVSAGEVAGFVNQAVKTFCHTSDLEEPRLNAGELGGTSTFFTILSPWSYDDDEKKAINDKFGADYTVIDAEIDIFTQAKLDDFTSQLSSDLRSGVLSRIDVVKTTKKLDLTPEVFEAVTANENLETSITIEGVEQANIDDVLSTSAPATSTAPATTATVSTSTSTSGGSY